VLDVITGVALFASPPVAPVETPEVVDDEIAQEMFEVTNGRAGTPPPVHMAPAPPPTGIGMLIAGSYFGFSSIVGTAGTVAVGVALGNAQRAGCPTGFLYDPCGVRSVLLGLGIVGVLVNAGVAVPLLVFGAQRNRTYRD
jgi:hypothetical protein